jgi:hypothetical protein
MALLFAFCGHSSGLVLRFYDDPRTPACVAFAMELDSPARKLYLHAEAINRTNAAWLPV